jgi:hypothetical protein
MAPPADMLAAMRIAAARDEYARQDAQTDTAARSMRE